jgi:Ser/Thr protein kinase RdoA (MazF antagonist)
MQLPCFSWNFEDFFGSSARWGDWSALPILTPINQCLLRQTVSLIEEKLRIYGKEPDRYGLIHSDLNIHNILVDNHAIQLIDFDDCGYGWFLLDMSISMLEYDKEIPYLLASWLTGYENIRLLSEEDKEMIPTFIILRKIVRLGWIATHLDNDTIKKIPKDYLRHTLCIAETYCRTKGTALFIPETITKEVTL